jgi:ferritin-like metal-binding protein YciE
MDSAFKLKLSRDHVFVAALNDLYLVERALVAALTKMSVAVTSPNLAAAFNRHQQATREHERRVQDVLFNATELRPLEGAQHSLTPLLYEGERLLVLPMGPEKDRAVLEHARKVERAEMDLYADLIHRAEAFDLPSELVGSLSETWLEEREADVTLALIEEEFFRARSGAISSVSL